MPTVPSALSAYAFLVGSWEEPSGARESWVVAGDRLVVGRPGVESSTEGAKVHLLPASVDGEVEDAALMTIVGDGPIPSTSTRSFDPG